MNTKRKRSAQHLTRGERERDLNEERESCLLFLFCFGYGVRWRSAVLNWEQRKRQDETTFLLDGLY